MLSIACIPQIDDVLDTLPKCQVFVFANFRSGYLHTSMADNCREKNVFAAMTSLYLLYCIRYGFQNTLVTFERMMTSVPAGLRWNMSLWHLDAGVPYYASFCTICFVCISSFWLIKRGTRRKKVVEFLQTFYNKYIQRKEKSEAFYVDIQCRSQNAIICIERFYG